MNYNDLVRNGLGRQKLSVLENGNRFIEDRINFKAALKKNSLSDWHI
jgi:hypothetical protein